MAKSRVHNLTLSDLVVCSLCDGILRSPIACRACEKPYCLSCIKTWQIETAGSTRCPNNCLEFVQLRCAPPFLHLLSTLQVSCRYESNGCTETLSYNNLETHEKVCDYRLLTCSGCEEKIVQEDFEEHRRTCPLASPRPTPKRAQLHQLQD